ncbi:phage tail terminator family protein [Cellulosilyticum lentocellum]|uniref:Phage protein n=1 Tax=Cellulosilyticum lentocellum (strain ATCC 49066 / DSM 5427 / NCIMB 11756 / RHM5) TaxID=642492 RepID=F2JK36_CELLD|nr:hypothetical protein [Cellulosilyticum lentocellum]ADZ84451.1 phage protein [Cellulosilyticum lentocellum DSM 5427]
MLNELIIGISQALDAAFSDVEIHTDQIKQGLVEPCFFIMLLEPSQEQVLGQRYYRENSFDIHYFPRKDNTSEINDVADKLMDTLEYIKFDGGLLRGTKMYSETVAGVLHFFVDYNFHTIKDTITDPYMEQLKLKGKVRNSE